MATNDKNAGTSPPPPGPPPSALEAAGFKMPDPSVVGRSMADIAERSQRLVGEWLKRQAQEDHAADPLNIGRAFMEMTARLMANPAKLMQAQLGFWQDYVTLWQNTTRRMMGIETEPVIDPAPGRQAASRTTPGRKTRSSTSSSSPTCCRRASCRTS